MKAKVWNLNKHEHREKFKDHWMVIPAGQYIVMDYVEAVEFKGQFTPIIADGTGRIDPKCYKMIKVERIDDASAVGGDQLARHVCQACTQMFSTGEELDEHIIENHKNILQDQKIAETLQKEVRRRGRQPKTETIEEGSEHADRVTA